MTAASKVRIAIMALCALIGSVHASTFAFNNYCGATAAANVITPWYCSYINQAAQYYWSQWSPIALVFVLFSFSIATVILVAGIAFRNDRLRSFGTGELYEALATLLIIVFFLFIASVLFGIVPGITTGPIDPYNSSLVYINQTIGTSEQIIGRFFNSTLVSYYYVSLGVSYCAVECFVTNNYYSYPITIYYIVPARTVTELLMDGVLVLNTEYYLILFLMYAAIPVFLIPGIFFRSFLPTRPMGGMMIAIAIGFYMLLPMLFSIAFYFTHISLLQTLNAESAALYTYGQGAGSQTNVVSASHPLVTAVQNIEASMGSYWLSVIFYPGLIMAMVYVVIRIIAEFIGGMASASSRLNLL